jgi:hypothetical protein
MFPNHYVYTEWAIRDAGQYVWSSGIVQFAAEDVRRTHSTGSEWGLKVRFCEHADGILGFINKGKFWLNINI